MPYHNLDTFAVVSLYPNFIIMRISCSAMKVLLSRSYYPTSVIIRDSTVFHREHYAGIGERPFSKVSPAVSSLFRRGKYRDLILAKSPRPPQPRGDFQLSSNWTRDTAGHSLSRNYNLKQNVPLLIKLHGSFNWTNGFPILLVDEKVRASRKQEEMIWIPPGIEKERDRYPFNLLWGKAFELLDCDTLRIVGCSLSQNDWGLMSLLFFSQMGATFKRRYEIEIINSHRNGEIIREKNGFLTRVKILGELEGCQDFVEVESENVFEDWLSKKLELFRREEIQFDQLDLKHVNQLVK